MTVAQTQVKSKRKVLLYPGEDGYFIVEVPSLPGCISQGFSKHRRSYCSLRRSFTRTG
jgi:hypothetical protein